jgi:tetratricopeptide (TPR) repeat protein
MIELMLQAERALSMGLVDRAEQLYWQAIETDSRNGIAVVGLAKIAIERGDDVTALRFARKALELDPDNGAGQRIAKRLEDAIVERGLLAEAAAAADAPDPVVAGPPPSVIDAAQAGTDAHETVAPAGTAAADHGAVTEVPAAETPKAAEPPKAADAAKAVDPKVADAPPAVEGPAAAAAHSRADVEWPAADLEQARRGTLPPVPPAGSSGAASRAGDGSGAGSPKGGASDWPGADSAPKSSPPGEGGRDGGRGKAGEGEGRGPDER